MPAAEFLRSIVPIPNVLRKRTSIRQAFDTLGLTPGWVLNIGARSSSFGADCVNMDIGVFPGVHVRGDAHTLPFQSASFDTCILSAVLQYCREPRVAVAEAARVLKPGGIMAIDVPFIQPYCPEADAFDLWRFTEHGLRDLVRDHCTVLQCEVSIPAPSAVAYCVQEWGNAVESRAGSYGTRYILGLFGLLLKRIPVTYPAAAGAFLLIGRK